MTNAEKIKQWSWQIPFDIKLEVLLAELIRDKLSLDDIVVMNNSLFKRNFHREIENIGEIEYDYSRKKKLLFLVNRDGIYDALPQDLFHQSPELGQNAGKDSVIAEIRNQEKIEKDTRTFFLPIEQEFYRQRVTLALDEQEFAAADGSSDLWDLPDWLDEKQTGKLAFLMPLLHKLTGNRSVIPYILEYCTGHKIQLCTSAPVKHEVQDPALLGAIRLGIDTTLDGLIPALQPATTIRISLTEDDPILECMPGGAMARLFEYLAHLLLPLETDIIIEWDLPEKNDFTIDHPAANTARLDYTTVI